MILPHDQDKRKGPEGPLFVSARPSVDGTSFICTMMHSNALLTGLAFLFCMDLAGQTPQLVSDPPPGKWYITSGGEWIFSTALLDVRTPGPNGTESSSDQGSIIRFSPFFNAQGVANRDFSAKAGMFMGLSIRNVGFIYDVPDTTLRFKYRTYNVGVPLGLKFGNMNGGLFFLGYEPELVINYKEKKFANERKEDKFNVWFSDRTDLFTHSFMAGVQFGNGACLKVKYYITNFHNADFEEQKDGVRYKPYAGLNANVLYVSLAFNLFKYERYEFPTNTPREHQARL